MSLSEVPVGALIAEASAIVAKALYYTKEKPVESLCNWMNRASREDRISEFRKRHNISEQVPEHIIIQAITEDWDLG